MAVSPLTKGQGKRIDQYRFPGARFTGQRGKATIEIDVNCIDDRKIMNMKLR